MHYNDVIMTTMASQITSLTVVYSTVYSDAHQRKHQSSASLAFVWGIHRDRWIPRTKGQLRKCFHLMTSSCISTEINRKNNQVIMLLQTQEACQNVPESGRNRMYNRQHRADYTWFWHIIPISREHASWCPDSLRLQVINRRRTALDLATLQNLRRPRPAVPFTYMGWL